MEVWKCRNVDVSECPIDAAECPIKIAKSVYYGATSLNEGAITSNCQLSDTSLWTCSQFDGTLRSINGTFRSVEHSEGVSSAPGGLGEGDAQKSRSLQEEPAVSGSCSRLTCRRGACRCSGGPWRIPRSFPAVPGRAPGRACRGTRSGPRLSGSPGTCSSRAPCCPG